MTWRVRIPALMVLMLFAWLCFLYYKSYVRKRSHGIILFVANGLDYSLLTSARRYTEVPTNRPKIESWVKSARKQVEMQNRTLNIETLLHLAVLNVQGRGEPVADEAALSTALACGERVKNGLVGCNALYQRLDTLIYAAQRASRATGLVTTSSLVQSTPVSFYSMLRNSGDRYRAAVDLLDAAHIDVVLGGGGQYFTPVNVTNEWGRTDGRDLVNDFSKQGYTVVHTGDELRHVPAWRTRQLLGIFAPDQFFFTGLPHRDNAEPSLADMTRTAIQCLQYNISGYFLVVEQGLVATAAKRNLTELAIDETLALDQAVRTAIDYAGSDALILVTNNFSLGAEDAEASTPESESSIAKSPRWQSGPGGRIDSAADRTWLRQQIKAGALSDKKGDLLAPDPAVFFAKEALPTNQPAWLASRGFGSMQLTGFFSNTDLYTILQEQF